ncbi:hypothetical protein B0H11DRAFT_2214829 [Mycena galericulata]|nr:hypothetical protein B0H11DRAFT_2214829 [Mycena galericulata]
MSQPVPQTPDLLEAFRLHFHRYHRAVDEVTSNQTDEVVLSRLHDDLQEYSSLVAEHTNIFPEEELTTLQTNLALMLSDVQILYQQAVDSSHHGRPTVVERVHTGQRGRPRIEIDPHFLQFAHEHRSTTGIGRFLGVSRSTVRSALLRQGLTQEQPAPFLDEPPPSGPVSDDEAQDDILDPDFEIPQNLPPRSRNGSPTWRFSWCYINYG